MLWLTCTRQVLRSPTTRHWVQGAGAMKGIVKQVVLKAHPWPECGKSFSKKGNLKRHQRIHAADELFACGECGRRFTSRGRPKTHQSIHTGERPFCCGECGHCFHLERCLAAHQKTHTKGGPCLCAHCGKSLSTKIYFTIPVWTHGEKRPFACTERGKSFVKKGTPTTHREIHKWEKLFKCPDCSRCFGQSATLLARQKIHLCGRPFVCIECGQSLSTKRYFSVHQNHAKQKPLKGHISGVPFQVIHIKEEPEFAFRAEENMLENSSHSCHEGEAAQGCGMPRNLPHPKSPPWKIQVKKELEAPTDGTANNTAIPCQKHNIKEEPPENPDYGRSFNPKGRQPKKEEDAGVQ